MGDLVNEYILWDKPGHKSDNLLLILVIEKDKLTDLCGKWLLQNDFKNTLCEMRSHQVRENDFGVGVRRAFGRPDVRLQHDASVPHVTTW